MTASEYPTIGYDPTPGNCETVNELKKKLEDSSKLLDDTHKLVTTLMDGSYWEGDAAVAFREQIEGGPLPINLKNASHSMEKAGKELKLWHDELEDFQRRARKLEDRAKTAEAARDRAEREVANADGDSGSGKDPDKKLDDAIGDVQVVYIDVRNLIQEYEDKAGKRAGNIRDATEKLAPHEPGLFEEIGSWIAENLPDILATMGAVIGLAALIFFTGGTAAILFLAAAALSAGALASRLSDPEVRASLMDGFTKGEFDSDFWGNLVAVGGDILGMVPGAGAAYKGAIRATRVAEQGGSALNLGQKLATFGRSTVDEMTSIAALGNPVTQWALRGAGVQNAGQVAGTVGDVSAYIGGATAAYGLGTKIWESLEDDTAGNAATGVDGFRFGVDVGSVVDLARYLR